MFPDRYPRMHEIFGAYFNQDFDLWGDTIPEIVACYKRDSPPDYHRELITEIDSFLDEHSKDLDSAFQRDCYSGFNPALWGYTTASFLDELKRLLGEQAP
ncbi:contact-dependent growth inhibition system immunity protein [Paraburkholderia ferrariae]|uniref:contact-dependent growth inhibition system immunity protein n=1 Tax=Paraburkholderia ferrariae TaxID=386056 RepID=UPI0004850928|nr:contact-dependent growth inhibition system immunity protein [Paraburkholderia ferrariae]